MADTTDSNPALKNQLLALCDNYAEFNACCAFFCDAVAALGTENAEWLDEVSAEGLSYQAQWLKERSAKLKADLAQVWQLART